MTFLTACSGNRRVSCRAVVCLGGRLEPGVAPEAVSSVVMGDRASAVHRPQEPLCIRGESEALIRVLKPRVCPPAIPDSSTPCLHLRVPWKQKGKGLPRESQ